MIIHTNFLLFLEGNLHEPQALGMGSCKPLALDQYVLKVYQLFPKTITLQMVLKRKKKPFRECLNQDWGFCRWYELSYLGKVKIVCIWISMCLNLLLIEELQSKYWKNKVGPYFLPYHIVFRYTHISVIIYVCVEEETLPQNSIFIDLWNDHTIFSLIHINTYLYVPNT